LHNSNLYTYLAAHDDLGTVFNGFMTAQSKLHNLALVEAYDFSGIRRLVDVGGGHGATLVALLSRNPEMKGVLFDLPEVVASRTTLEVTGFADRCEVVAGDMLRSVPSGADAYVIKRVLMDKVDTDAVTVLRNCLDAMNEGGKVLVIDPVLPDETRPHLNWLIDLHMLVITGGQLRTEMQFRDLFDAAGLRLSRVIPTRSPNFILEGTMAA